MLLNSLVNSLLDSRGPVVSGPQMIPLCTGEGPKPICARTFLKSKEQTAALVFTGCCQLSGSVTVGRSGRCGGGASRKPPLFLTLDQVARGLTQGLLNPRPGFC